MGSLKSVPSVSSAKKWRWGEMKKWRDWAEWAAVVAVPFVVALVMSATVPTFGRSSRWVGGPWGIRAGPVHRQWIDPQTKGAEGYGPPQSRKRAVSSLCSHGAEEPWPTCLRITGSRPG